MNINFIAASALENTALGAPAMILAVISLIVTIAWIFLPFLILGALKKILLAQNQTNATLVAILKSNNQSNTLLMQRSARPVPQ